MVLSGGIGLGLFVKPLPLPPGDWLVVNKNTDAIPLTGGRLSSTPRIILTLKNNAPHSLLFAMVLTFTPDTSRVNWQNSKCEEAKTNVLVDDFGLDPTGFLFACAKTWSESNFQSTIEKSPTSTNNWRKTNLAPLAAYPGDIENKALWIYLHGNRYLDREIKFIFFVKREGKVSTDPAYASLIKTWVHATGLTLLDVLQNKTTSFTLPPAYLTPPLQKPDPAPVQIATKPDEPAKKPATKLPADNTEKLRADLETQRRLLEDEKRAFEQRKATELEQARQNAEKDWKDQATKAKTACLQAFNVALKADEPVQALRQFMKKFPENECDRHTQASQKMAELEDLQRKEALTLKTRTEQARALIGLMAAYQEEFPYCEGPKGSRCLDITYRFEVKGKIVNIDGKRESVQVLVAEVVWIGHKAGADKQLATRWQEPAIKAFQTRMVGSKQWKTKSDVGVDF